MLYEKLLLSASFAVTIIIIIIKFVTRT